MSRRRRSASRSRICSGASARGPIRPANAERDYPMAITRTAKVDDDGSGTPGTIINIACRTEFYNKIDAALPAAGPSYLTGSWTPGLTDSAGGAAAAYSIRSGTFVKGGALEQERP